MAWIHRTPAPTDDADTVFVDVGAITGGNVERVCLVDDTGADLGVEANPLVVALVLS